MGGKYRGCPVGRSVGKADDRKTERRKDGSRRVSGGRAWCWRGSFQDRQELGSELCLLSRSEAGDAGERGGLTRPVSGDRANGALGDDLDWCDAERAGGTGSPREKCRENRVLAWRRVLVQKAVNEQPTEAGGQWRSDAGHSRELLDRSRRPRRQARERLCVEQAARPWRGDPGERSPQGGEAPRRVPIRHGRSA